MTKNLKKALFFRINTGLFAFIPFIASSLMGTSPLLNLFNPRVREVKADFEVLAQNLDVSEFSLIQSNSVAGLSGPHFPENNLFAVKRAKAIVTAYSSTPWETDEDPYITASGAWVKDGIVANNKYSFGTKVRFPEIYGDKVFVVKDRMNPSKGLHQFDVWFPSYQGALEFGVKRVEVEVLN